MYILRINGSIINISDEGDADLELSKRTVKRILLIITFTVLLIWGVYNHKQLGELLGSVYSVISPFIAGLCIAYIINVRSKGCG